MKLIAIALLTVCIVPCAVRSGIISSITGSLTKGDSIADILDGTLDDITGTSKSLIELLLGQDGSSQNRDSTNLIDRIKDLVSDLGKSSQSDDDQVIHQVIRPLIDLLEKFVEFVLKGSTKGLKEFLVRLSYVLEILLEKITNKQDHQIGSSVLVDIRVLINKLSANNASTNDISNSLQTIISNLKKLLSVNNLQDNSNTTTKNSGAGSIKMLVELIAKLEISLHKGDSNEVIEIIQQILNALIKLTQGTSGKPQSSLPNIAKDLDTLQVNLSTKNVSLSTVSTFLQNTLESLEQESGSDGGILQIVCSLLESILSSTNKGASSVTSQSLRSTPRLISSLQTNIKNGDLSKARSNLRGLLNLLVKILPQIRSQSSFKDSVQIVFEINRLLSNNASLKDISAFLATSKKSLTQIVVDLNSTTDNTGSSGDIQKLPELISNLQDSAQKGDMSSISGLLKQILSILNELGPNASDGISRNKISSLITTIKTTLQKLSNNDDDLIDINNLIKNIRESLPLVKDDDSSYTTEATETTKTTQPTIGIETTTDGSDNNSGNIQSLENLIENLQKSIKKDNTSNTYITSNVQQIYIILKELLPNVSNGKPNDAFSSITTELKTLLSSSSPNIVDISKFLQNLQSILQHITSSSGSIVPTGKNNIGSTGTTGLNSNTANTGSTANSDNGANIQKLLELVSKLQKTIPNGDMISVSKLLENISFILKILDLKDPKESNTISKVITSIKTVYQQLKNKHASSSDISNLVKMIQNCATLITVGNSSSTAETTERTGGTNTIPTTEKSETSIDDSNGSNGANENIKSLFSLLDVLRTNLKRGDTRGNITTLHNIYAMFKQLQSQSSSSTFGDLISGLINKLKTLLSLSNVSSNDISSFLQNAEKKLKQVFGSNVSDIQKEAIGGDSSNTTESTATTEKSGTKTNESNGDEDDIGNGKPQSLDVLFENLEASLRQKNKNGIYSALEKIYVLLKELLPQIPSGNSSDVISSIIQKLKTLLSSNRATSIGDIETFFQYVQKSLRKIKISSSGSSESSDSSGSYDGNQITITSNITVDDGQVQGLSNLFRKLIKYLESGKLSNVRATLQSVHTFLKRLLSEVTKGPTHDAISNIITKLDTVLNKVSSSSDNTNTILDFLKYAQSTAQNVESSSSASSTTESSDSGNLI